MPKPATDMIIKCLSVFDIVLPDNTVKVLTLADDFGDLQNDSRAIHEGDIFCAIIGNDQDGRQYIEQAVSQGAKLVLAECESSVKHGDINYSINDKNIAIISFYQLNQQIFSLAKSYYQQPQNNMTVVGITGTNGKTTTSQLLSQMLTTKDLPCAVIGTNGAGSLDKLTPIENTTPGACELHQLFTRFHDEHFSHVSMEVSSHALSQKRVLADLFNIALFTNLSRDHLDYHGSMADYGKAKSKIFTTDASQVAVINADDEYGQFLIENWPSEQALWLYGQQCDFSEYSHFVSAQNVDLNSNGVTFTLVSHLGNIDIISPLLGGFNIDNLLAAISVLLIQGVALNEIPSLVSQVNATAGRMEAHTAPNLATAVVDYAHTPDALEKALKACRLHCEKTLYVVFGCGGDRDKGKRALMARIAEDNADMIVITNDNPRTENPQHIANDIVAGLNKPNSEKMSIILDREQAVLTTLAKAKAGDIVLLAGKGHEDYVILAKHDESGVVIGTQKLAYNEREVVANFYNAHRRSPNLAVEERS